MLPLETGEVPRFEVKQTSVMPAKAGIHGGGGAAYEGKTGFPLARE
jgi:hypothetical protein